MPRSFHEEDLLRTTAMSAAVLNALGPAIDELIDPHLRVDHTKPYFDRTARPAEVATPTQVAQSRDSALFAKLVEIPVRSLGALGNMDALVQWKLWRRKSREKLR
jgi:hypothetical protein